MAEISVLVADSQYLFAQALASGLSSFPGLCPVTEVAVTMEAALEATIWLRPDVVILDYWIPGKGPVAAAIAALREQGAQVLALSSVIGPDHVDNALRAGAAGFLPKTISVVQLGNAVYHARAGEVPVYAEHLRTLLDGVDRRAEATVRRSEALETLSPREAEVLRLLHQGLSAEQIASELFIHRGTLRNHIHTILKKLGTHSQQEAVQMVRASPSFLPPPIPERPRRAGATQPSVMVADGERLAAEAIGHALEPYPDLEVVGVHFGVGLGGVRAAIATQPDFLVYDYWMPGTSGPAAARYLASWAPRTRVLLLAWLPGPHQVAEALAAGALGVLSKKRTVQEVVDTIRCAQARRPLIHAEKRRPWAAGPSADTERCWNQLRSLTPREIDVLYLLCDGRSAEQAATELGITDGTARNYIQRILKKTGTRSKLEALELVRREGLVREAGAPPPLEVKRT